MIEHIRIGRGVDKKIARREGIVHIRRLLRRHLRANRAWPGSGLDIAVNQFQAMRDKIHLVSTDIAPVAIISFEIAGMKNVAAQPVRTGGRPCAPGRWRLWTQAILVRQVRLASRRGPKR